MCIRDRLDTVPANAASYRAALEELGFTVTDEYYAERCTGGHYTRFLPPLMGGTPSTCLLYTSCLRFANVYGPHIDCLRKQPPFVGYMIRELYYDCLLYTSRCV